MYIILKHFTQSIFIVFQFVQKFAISFEHHVMDRTVLFVMFSIMISENGALKSC